MQIIWEGNWIAPNGHATVTRNMTRALLRQGLKVKLRTTEMPPPEHYAEFIQKDFLRMMARPYQKQSARIRIMHRIPPDFRKTQDLLSVGLTYSESTNIPPDWAFYVNDTVDALIVANAQSQTAFEAAGITKPIWVVPHGVNVRVFRPGRTSYQNQLNLPSFRFLSVFEWVPRKGYEILARAFWEEFSAQEDVCLVIKTRSFRSSESRGPADELRQLKAQLHAVHAARIYLVDKDLPVSQLAALYRSSSAFVLPTRGESVGLPLLEAAASELPIITTAWGGPLEFLPPENAYLVHFALTPVPAAAAQEAESLNGFWAEPNITSLRHLMREVYENFSAARERAQRLRQHIVQTRSWNACARGLIQYLEQAIGGRLR